MRNPSRLRLGLRLVLALALAAPVPSRGAESDRPNVLLIMTDDQGWGDLGRNGNPFLKTPVLDGFGDEAVRFDRFYVSPVCSPTRAALLTGRYALRTGVTGVARGRETMRSDEVTIAELFRDAGYATGCFGKWHNGPHYPNHPNGQGFEEFFGFCGGHTNDYFDPVLERNGKPVRTKGYITDVITNAAIAFIREHRNEPFFCYIPYNAPHAPLQVPDREYERYRAQGLDEPTSAIYGMCENIDENVGRLLEQLDDSKLRERTLVLFLTDNGPSTVRYNGGMKGAKASVDEGGTRVPLMIRWPGRLPAGRVVEPIAADFDLLPTIAELCGVALPDGLQLDGVSLVPLLRGEAGDWKERTLFVHQPREAIVGQGDSAVRTQAYRAVRSGARLPWELYDMRTDASQTTNVAAQNPQIVQEIGSAYDEWFTDCTRGVSGPPPISVGFPEAPTVSLPTTECSLQGNLRYENQLGWTDDWATGWTSADDRMEWKLDVVRAGRYDVTLLQTAPREAVGTVLSITAGEESCRATIRRSYDPPAENRPDRDPAAKRRVKSFAEMKLGTLRLPSGPVSLVLGAAEVVGPRIADVHSVKLRYVGP